MCSFANIRPENWVQMTYRSFHILYRAPPNHSGKLGCPKMGKWRSCFPPKFKFESEIRRCRSCKLALKVINCLEVGMNSFLVGEIKKRLSFFSTLQTKKKKIFLFLNQKIFQKIGPPFLWYLFHFPDWTNAEKKIIFDKKNYES